MSRAESRQMADKIMAAKADNAARRLAEERQRLDCPVEKAKAFLRQRGWHVFKENVLTGRWTGQRIIVGRTPYEPEEVIAMAQRIRERMAA